MNQPPCTTHPEQPAVERCRSCRRWLCDTCWRGHVDGVPWCAGCVQRIQEQRDPLPVAFAVTLLALGVAGPTWALRNQWLDQGEALLVGAGAVVAALFLLVRAMGRHGPGPLSPRVQLREPQAEPPAPTRRMRYRDTARRLTRRMVAPVSGRGTVLLLVVCFAASATLVPWSLRLAPWLEAEAAVAACWLVLAVTLATFLHRGARVADDHFYRTPPPTPRAGTSEPTRNGWLDGCSSLDGCGNADGCGEAVVLVVALAVIAGIAFLVVEFLFPALFLLLYTVLRRAVARVANDDHECQGNLGRALLWGAAWSLLYCAPIAIAVWVGHALQRR